MYWSFENSYNLYDPRLEKKAQQLRALALVLLTAYYNYKTIYIYGMCLLSGN